MKTWGEIRRVRSMELVKLLAVTVSLLLCQIGTSTAAFDIAHILDAYPEFSLLNQLLNMTLVAEEINKSKGGVTLFAPSNSVLSSFQAGVPSSLMTDVLRHHVATEYLELIDLQGLTADSFLSVTTLMQTAADLDVLVIFDNELGTVINNTINTSVVGSITSVEKEISIMGIDNVLRPVRLIPSLPPPPKGSEILKSFNISRTLATLQDFEVFSRYLEETGVDSLLEGRQGTEQGCTIFVPTDAAFDALPGNWFQKLSKNDQRLFLEYHSLGKFYSLGDLWQLRELSAETIASMLTNPAGTKFMLNMDSTHGTVHVRAGRSSAIITSTLYQSNPVIMFGIDSVLLPTEIFGDSFAFAPSPDGSVESPSSPGLPPVPSASSPVARNQPTPQASPPVVRSGSGGRAAGNPALAFMRSVTIMASVLVSSRLVSL